MDQKITVSFQPPADLEPKALVGGAHEAGSRLARELAMWSPPIQSADQDVIPEKQLIDARARDVLRNDAYVRGGSVIHQDSIVGGYYALNSKPLLRVLGPGFDEVWEEEFQEEVETRFGLWAESVDCWADAARTKTFTEMVRLAVGVHTAGGEVLATVEWLRDAGRPFNTAIQFVDIDRLGTPTTAVGGRRRIVGGVEKDQRGAPVAYYIRMAHPADFQSADSYRWRRVPARKPWGRPQVIHIFEQHRPDQSRGVTQMVTALKEIQMTRKFRSTVLQNAILNATYAASIESDLPSADVFAAIGATDNPAEAYGAVAAAYLAEIAKYSGGAKNLTLDGVKIPHLFPGTKLQLRPAGEGGPLGAEFETSLLRYLAASLGISYEQLAKDYTKTNYSSARAAMAETWKRMMALKKQVADRFATTIYRLWLEEALNKGLIDSMPRFARQPGWIYEAQRLDALAGCDWIGAARGQIDELKETQAAILRLKHNLSTEEDEIARFGRDWRYVKRQRARERKVNADLGLPDSADVATVAREAPSPNDEDQE